ncbi:COA8 family protein CBG23705, mitochondrial [Parasteatoda tepidariorum]|uniref:COA8 family protein CBG23705, mitochondrial n=1 Tax=Parasteatoda tepidariorum TaxID=114398 RepID=UPI001C71E97B|nr:COA8 family protein CBG23705, mitochondrial [Parasteatoda tepidariorum]
MHVLKRGFRSNFKTNLYFFQIMCYKYDCPRLHSNSSKYFEGIKTKPFSENDNHIWVSPPHPKSNLRLKVFPTSQHLSKEEKAFYQKYEETQDWNHEYWETHNNDFKNSRKLYIEKISKEKNLSKDENLTDEDMSHFYRDFLERNHKKHMDYNWSWYKKNLNLLYLAAKVNIGRFKRFFKKI